MAQGRSTEIFSMIRGFGLDEELSLNRASAWRVRERVKESSTCTKHVFRTVEYDPFIKSQLASRD